MEPDELYHEQEFLMFLSLPIDGCGGFRSVRPDGDSFRDSPLNLVGGDFSRRDLLLLAFWQGSFRTWHSLCGLGFTGSLSKNLVIDRKRSGTFHLMITS
jgi:hypothetical protein